MLDFVSWKRVRIHIPRDVATHLMNWPTWKYWIGSSAIIVYLYIYILVSELQDSESELQ